MNIRPIDRHVIDKLKEIYKFVIPEEEIWQNVIDFKRAKNGEDIVLVVHYGYLPQFFIIPNFPSDGIK